MRRPETPWGLLAILGLVLEAWALRNKRKQSTLSYAIRMLFNVKSLAGRTVFTAAWIALTVWIVPHIVRKETDV